MEALQIAPQSVQHMLECLSRVYKVRRGTLPRAWAMDPVGAVRLVETRRFSWHDPSFHVLHTVAHGAEQRMVMSQDTWPCFVFRAELCSALVVIILHWYEVNVGPPAPTSLSLFPLSCPDVKCCGIGGTDSESWCYAVRKMQ